MKRPKSDAGFTLLETLLSIALTALIVGMLLTIGRQWLLEWRIGFGRIEELDHIELAKDRITRDLQSALNLPMISESIGQRFIGEGSRIIFVREPLARDKTDHLVVVEYTSDPDRGVIRRTSLYDSSLPLEKLRLGEPIAVLPAPYVATFSYRDADGQDSENWTSATTPEIVLISISHIEKNISQVSQVTPHATLSSSCAAANSHKQCRLIMQQQSASSSDPKLNGNVATDSKDAMTP